MRDGVLAAVVHFEGAEPIDPRLDALEFFYAAGLCSLGPVWSRPNDFGEGVPYLYPHSPDTGPGLTHLGKELVRACNRLGVVVDVSHLNERGFWDIAALTNAPLVATHSNAHALTPSPRNLTDKQLDAITESGGIVGVNFYVGFLRADGANDRGCADRPHRRAFSVSDRAHGRGPRRFRRRPGRSAHSRRGPRRRRRLRVVTALQAAGDDDAALRKLTHRMNWLRVLGATWK